MRRRDRTVTEWRIEWRDGEAWVVDRRLRQVRVYGPVRVSALLVVIEERIEKLIVAEDEMDHD